MWHDNDSTIDLLDFDYIVQALLGIIHDGSLLPATIGVRGNVSKKEIEEREGFAVTRPVRAIVDLIIEESVQVDIILQAYREANKRGLILDDDFDDYRNDPVVDRKIIECIPGLK